MTIDKQARLVSSARISEIAKGANLIMGEKEWLANTAIYLANELKTATKAFQSTGFSLLEAEEKLEAAEKRIAELESKLANPVLLPKTNGYWNEQEKAYEEAITLAKRQVRLAGFSVEDM